MFEFTLEKSLFSTDAERCIRGWNTGTLPHSNCYIRYPQIRWNTERNRCTRTSSQGFFYSCARVTWDCWLCDKGRFTGIRVGYKKRRFGRAWYRFSPWKMKELETGLCHEIGDLHKDIDPNLKNLNYAWASNSAQLLLSLSACLLWSSNFCKFFTRHRKYIAKFVIYSKRGGMCIWPSLPLTVVKCDPFGWIVYYGRYSFVSWSCITQQS